KNYAKTKAFMYKEPELWFMLMDKLAEMIITYATAQLKAGISAIQIFDAWVGSLNASDYQIYIKPTMNYIFTELRKLNVTLILFGIGERDLILEFNYLAVDALDHCCQE